ncbi:MAG: phosphoribosylformylglycinamidine synthase subunit PurL [Saprospiraceae bacterium]|nr:phosphoribosylformylglycinamidine synthase subunit PurL [Saprospiraceae bacterium]
MTATEVKVTVETAKNLGLLPEEFDKICEIMGRTPNFTELSIFSVMWSEHCSYKNSITYLKKLPRDGKRLLVGAGEENAGLVDIGDGLACCFKIESHNHPSAIEPFQGAATGVGGIQRDIFTMGARPIASLNSLRFGDLSSRHMRRLVKGVVEGIGHYGNCFGVPTVGGEVYFNDCYNHDILVNAMSAGIVKVGETISATAEGIGNPVFIVGSSTGKDGIHGATFASADLDENSAEDLPSVQVGDPFQEKLLLEATLEIIATGVVVGMQDMGAAGIICSTSEMSAKGEVGMRIDLDKVPKRQQNMKDWEILLSESQERMLIVVKKGEEQKVLDVFDKWDLQCAEIGEVTDTGRLEFFYHNEKVADVPAEPLVLGGGAPVYQREFTTPQYFADIAQYDISQVPEPTDLLDTAKNLWQSPNIASKRWIYEQYDSMVRTGTMTTNEPADAALVRVNGTRKALALTTDCNSAYVYADPYKGGLIAVAEAARNIVCSGGEPVAITNCLNFGNPYDKEVYYQFVHALQGMGDACRRFDTPVTGGNVSFYNQMQKDGKTVPVFPTPTIGMLGILDDYDNRMSLDFKAEGDTIYLIGTSRNDVSSSEYLMRLHKVKHSPAPHFDLEEEINVQNAVQNLIRNKMIQSAHDVSEGGLFVALMESGMPRTLGFELENVIAKNEATNGVRTDAYLFGESQSRVVVSVSPAKAADFDSYMTELGVDFSKIGRVTGEQVRIFGEDWGNITTWKKTYDNLLGDIMNEE